ncbi:Leucine-rich repeat protein SHOC-2 [Astathelohania contejeani]|uniref:Leucine-rich repeat protein SHOC-2 n=1 Tax=Astathelohania contejeani TaxID=164912 RepID=A0ABQ7HW54_9MICR|nr:Leucine-rich repeat protein SHOC-2 [Thelohania contejeani]
MDLTEELITLDLSRQGYNSIPTSVFTDGSIKWLILSNNNLREIPGAIGENRVLTRLALNDNKIQKIHPNIGLLKHLSWIDLTRNRLSSLPIEMRHLNRVQGLGLSENEFEEIPECVYHLFALRKFGFFSNRIQTISPNIKNLSRLVKIDLSNNQIRRIPDEFCELKNLTWLNLSNNQLETLPENMEKLRYLEELGLGCNRLTTLPSLKNLSRLRILPIFKNRLCKTPEISLQNIEKLDLSDNKLTEFPNKLIYSRTLRYLNLKRNLIRKIDFDCEQRGLSSGISMIDISENLLESLPFKFFTTFSKVTTIRLSGNPFRPHAEQLPQECPSLLQLCYTKYLNKRGWVADLWLRYKFGPSMICDICGNEFVGKAIDGYSIAPSSDEMSNFVIKKTICSVWCYWKDYEGIFRKEI